jgi:integrase
MNLVQTAIAIPEVRLQLAAVVLAEEMNFTRAAERLNITQPALSKQVSDVRTVEVEEWLHSLPYAPATKSKIRNIMSAVFNHAIRYEWTHHNPITKVRASSKRLREPDVLTPAEFAALVDELPLRVKTMVILAGSTGLRRSELVALTWRDVDLLLMQINVLRSCVRGRFGDTKTEASRKPVPLHTSVIECLDAWRKESLYNSDDDFLFPSVRKEGRTPVTPVVS